MNILKTDFIRFAQLHSWYKHIPLEGTDYYACLEKGEQLRYSFCPEVNDYEGQHWHFYLKDTNTNNAHIKEYGPIHLGPFLQGVHDNTHCKYVLCSFHIIFSRNKDTFLDWIELNYPEYKNITLEEWENKDEMSNDPIIIDICTKETNKYWENLLHAINL